MVQKPWSGKCRVKSLNEMVGGMECGAQNATCPKEAEWPEWQEPWRVQMGKRGKRGKSSQWSKKTERAEGPQGSEGLWGEAVGVQDTFEHKTRVWPEGERGEGTERRKWADLPEGREGPEGPKRQKAKEGPVGTGVTEWQDGQWPPVTLHELAHRGPERPSWWGGGCGALGFHHNLACVGFI